MYRVSSCQCDIIYGMGFLAVFGLRFVYRYLCERESFWYRLNPYFAYLADLLLIL